MAKRMDARRRALFPHRHRPDVAPGHDEREMIYHLAVPRARLATHGGFPSSTTFTPIFPNRGDVLPARPGNGGEAAAKLFHIASGFLLFLAVLRFALGLPDRKHARQAATAFLSIPTVIAIIRWPTST